MSSSVSYPLPRERYLILGLLLVLSAAAWGLLIWQAMTPGHAMGGLTMGMSTLLFLGIWVVMMVAMMFPTAAPMILMFARVSAGRAQQGRSFVPTWIFVGAYLVVWAAFGVLAYVLAVSADAVASSSMWVMDNTARLGGGVLVLAGLYQLTPLKEACLAKCRTPLSFILTSWREGSGGAFRMGLEHGVYCLGCCWLLFVILFPLGMMNVAAMAVLTALIFAEKSLPVSRRITQGAAAVLILYGVAVIFLPHLLPTMMQMESM